MYVELLIDFIFNTQCEEQYKAFKKGFYKTLSEDVVALFHPDELDLLICGTKFLDFSELEKSTRYVDGYTKESPIAEWLWDVIKNDMTDYQRKKFL